MGKHRSRLGILSKILSVINDNNGAKKTQIMYDAYLSYELLIRYINDLMKSELITRADDHYYRVSDRGKNFLAKFSEYSRLNKYINEKVNHIENQRLTLEGMCPVTKKLNINQKIIKSNNTLTEVN